MTAFKRVATESKMKRKEMTRTETMMRTTRGSR